MEWNLLSHEPLLMSKLSQLSSHFVSTVACGQAHTLFLTSSGFVYSIVSLFIPRETVRMAD